jgi:large subunit ribosomal protein L3
MGDRWLTCRNLQVVRLEAERSLLVVRGGTPGPNGGQVIVYPTNKKKKGRTSK